MYINSKTGCIAVGNSKDNGTYKEIGEKKTPLLEFSLAVDKDENDKTVWFNCKVWNPLAKRFREKLKKGEPVVIFGKWETRKSAGKDYSTLVGQYLAVTKDEISQVATGVFGEEFGTPTDEDIPDFMK